MCVSTLLVNITSNKAEYGWVLTRGILKPAFGLDLNKVNFSAGLAGIL